SLVSSLPEFRLVEKEGFTNFVSSGIENTVRYYSPFATFENKLIPSFSTLVVQKFNQNAYNHLIARESKTEIINYRGNIEKFITFDVDDVHDSNPNLEIIRNKIVLFGFIGNSLQEQVLEDIHFTPLNSVYSGRSYPDMYGLVIQANIISMILNGNFINRMGKLLLFLVSFMICYLHMYAFVAWYVR